MTALSPLQIYQRMFAAPGDGLAAYWYFGTMSVQVEDLPMLPVITAETLMVYKTRSVSETELIMDWWEIGVMRDPVTGEIAETWVNPITGAIIPTPRKFEEGPAGFTVRQVGEKLEIELVQAHAKIIGVATTITERDGRLFLNQVERKHRGFPRPDGSFPEPGEPGSFEARTQLSIWGDKAEVETSDYAFTSGCYDFELGLPPWMGFGERTGTCLTRGIMRKAPMNRQLNPIAWARLKAEYPERFEGDDVRPVWR
jgi:hypothetical protein